MIDRTTWELSYRVSTRQRDAFIVETHLLETGRVAQYKATSLCYSCATDFLSSRLNSNTARTAAEYHVYTKQCPDDHRMCRAATTLMCWSLGLDRGVAGEGEGGGLGPNLLETLFYLHASCAKRSGCCFFSVSYYYYQLYPPPTVVDIMKTIERNQFRCTAAQNITIYYNICKADSPRSYTATRTCLVFS